MHILYLVHAGAYMHIMYVHGACAHTYVCKERDIYTLRVRNIYIHYDTYFENLRAWMHIDFINILENEVWPMGLENV